MLDAIASNDPERILISFQWTKDYRPAPSNIFSVSSAKTLIKNLVEEPIGKPSALKYEELTIKKDAIQKKLL